jgi:hypothetical protein
MPPASLVLLPLKTKNDKGWDLLHQPILWPHEWFAALYSQYPTVFVERLLGGAAEKVGAFWRAVSAHPGMRDFSHESPDKAIPICISGDGVPVVGIGKTWQRGVDVWHWFSLLGDQSSLGSYWLISAVWGHLLVDTDDANTKNALLKKIWWSMMALWKGEWPTEDEEGMPLRGTPQGKLADGWLL